MREIRTSCQSYSVERNEPERSTRTAGTTQNRQRTTTCVSASRSWSRSCGSYAKRHQHDPQSHLLCPPNYQHKPLIPPWTTLSATIQQAPRRGGRLLTDSPASRSMKLRRWLDRTERATVRYLRTRQEPALVRILVQSHWRRLSRADVQHRRAGGRRCRTVSAAQRCSACQASAERVFPQVITTGTLVDEAAASAAKSPIVRFFKIQARRSSVTPRDARHMLAFLEVETCFAALVHLTEVFRTSLIAPRTAGQSDRVQIQRDFQRRHPAIGARRSSFPWRVSGHAQDISLHYHLEPREFQWGDYRVTAERRASRAVGIPTRRCLYTLLIDPTMQSLGIL